MDPAQSVTATTTATTGTSQVPGVGFDIISPIIAAFGNSETAAGLFTLGGILGILSIIWSVYAVLAYLVTILFLGLYVYASVRKNLYEELQTQALRDAEALFDEQYRGKPRSSRLDDVLTHLESENPNDWKLAVIEADIILDDILKKQGYAGTTLGERLRSISPQSLGSLQDAWEAHKVRNKIAHEGADFVLTHRIARDTIARYRNVFTEFGVT